MENYIYMILCAQKKKRAARFSNNCTVKTHFLLNTINKVMGYVKTKSKRKFKGEEEDG